MKNGIISAAIIAAIMGAAHAAHAQSAEENAEKLKVGVGGSFGKPKIMPKMEKFGLAQVTVNYMLSTTERTMGKERSTGKMAGAKLTAYLETTDGALTPADFQEVTDHFYGYFQKKLKQAGIDTVAWSAVSATDFYKNAEDKKASNEEEKGEGNIWVTCNAHNGNTMYNGTTAFAFGKIKKAANFCGDIDAPAGFFHLTVDFADIMLNVTINTNDPGYSTSLYPYKTVTTNTKFKAVTKPAMKIVPSEMGTNTLLWNEKQQGESIGITDDIDSKVSYHTNVTQDRSRMKNNPFRFNKEMDPVIIETTRAKYKEAAEKALDNYADAFVAKVVMMKKD